MVTFGLAGVRTLNDVWTASDIRADVLDGHFAAPGPLRGLPLRCQRYGSNVPNRAATAPAVHACVEGQPRPSMARTSSPVAEDGVKGTELQASR